MNRIQNQSPPLDVRVSMLQIYDEQRFNVLMSNRIRAYVRTSALVARAAPI